MSGTSDEIYAAMIQLEQQLQVAHNVIDDLTNCLATLLVDTPHAWLKEELSDVITKADAQRVNMGYDPA